MKKIKSLLLLVLSSMLLSACALFNDNDIKFENHFNDKATPIVTPAEATIEGVDSTRIDEVSNALVFKNIGYGVDGKVENTYKIGGVHENEFNVNNNEDYLSTTSNNNYDLYVPEGLKKDEEQLVMLFIHGGAWIGGFKTDVNSYCYEFANKGYITATIKYTLLKKTMDDSSRSIFRNLDEIDACIKSIKNSLISLGFNGDKLKLIIGGFSSGSHLTMLYTYSRGSESAIPIKFIVDAVGPTDIKPKAWKDFKVATDLVLSHGIEKDAIEYQETSMNIKQLEVSGEGYDWNEYQTMRIANGMCGMPFTKEEIENTTTDNIYVDTSKPAADAMLKANGGEDQLSVTHYISTTSKYPIICAYSGLDSVVGIGQYANLQGALETYSVPHEFFYFKECGHTDIDKDTEQYSNLLAKIDDWAKSSIIE